jgi:sigma-E factor negative regulatory protein RseC
MEHPCGTVRSVLGTAEGERVIVEVDVRAVCSRCAAGKGCGAGLLTGKGNRRQIEARARTGLALAAGDTVELELAPRELLRAAATVYGIPMLGALLAAAAAYGLALGEAAAAIAALAGLGTGLLASRWYLGRPACMARFIPTVTARVENPGGAR